jgi:hypothetical protein
MSFEYGENRGFYQYHTEEIEKAKEDILELQKKIKVYEDILEASTSLIALFKSKKCKFKICEKDEQNV